MGKTSVNTACNPRFFRLEGAMSAWRNSLYESVCNSIRFGGAMISLIFPKLMRSVNRDGIWTFYIGWRPPPTFVFSKRHEASVLCSQETCRTKTVQHGFVKIISLICFFRYKLQVAAAPA